MIIKTKPTLSPTMASTISLILLLDLFVVAWMSILFVASELFPDDSIRLMLSELWVGKMDIVIAFTGIGVALTLYLNLKQSFNPILWVPILMTVSVISSGFTAGYVTQAARVSPSASSAELIIVPVLVISIAMMIYSLKLYKKYQSHL